MNIDYIKGQIAKKTTEELLRCHEIYANCQSKNERDALYRGVLEDELSRREGGWVKYIE